MRLEAISVDILDAEGNTTLVRIATPAGTAKMLGDLRLDGRILYIERAHIEGLRPGAVGRVGINAVLRKLMVEAGVDKIVIQGATRTTGRYNGHVPRVFVFPR